MAPASTARVTAVDIHFTAPGRPAAIRPGLVARYPCPGGGLRAAHLELRKEKAA